MRYSYKNILGEFVFDKGFTELKEGPGQEPISAAEKPQVLSLFCERRFLKRFREANLRETKKKIRESVSKGSLIVQVSSLIEELDKVFNTIAKRLREWYSYVLPELCDTSDNEKLVKAAQRPRDQLMAELGIKETMGADLADEDVEQILVIAREGERILDLKRQQKHYLEKLMQEHCPNLCAVAGASLGAKLLVHAGSLMKLAEMPSSTVQLLGAEKALFRHLRSGARPPKHGVILQHELLGKARQKGKAARLMADKISMASKIDYFNGEYIGEKLRMELEKKLEGLR